MQVPSKAHLWTRCALAGSLLAGRGGGYVSPHADNNDDTDSRREGSAAHWLAARIMRGETTCLDAVGMTAPNGWTIDRDMARHVQDYVDYVLQYAGQHVPSETVINIDNIIVGRLDDAVIVTGDVVRIFDLKYGWRIVEPDNNPELLCYGVALADGHTAIELHIYQPRPFHPDGPARKWRIEPHQVHEYREWLLTCALKADGEFGEPQGTPGQQCRNCMAAASCHALAASVYAQYETVRDARMGKMSAEQLAAELTFLDDAETLLKARKHAVEAEAEGRIVNEFLPGWEIQSRLGHRKFTVSPEQVHMMTGISPYRTAEMSPAELERAGAKKDIVATITHTPVIGKKLVRSTIKTFERMFRS